MLRALRYPIQEPQGKLVRMVLGEVLDVAVDLRRSSPHFGRWATFVLSAGSRRPTGRPPLSARLIADTTALILQQTTAHGTTEKTSWAQAGLYHLSCGGSTSWYDFARRVLAWQAAQTGRAGPAIEAITTAQYPTPATRTHNSVLNNQRLRDTFGLVLPHWERAFELCFEDIHVAV